MNAVEYRDVNVREGAMSGKKESKKDVRRSIPSIQKMIEVAQQHEPFKKVPHVVLKRCARIFASLWRSGKFDGALQDWEQAFVKFLGKALNPGIKKVINATGVILHTNLGRCPLPAEALHRWASLARGYVNLEYDLDKGERTHRDTHLHLKFKLLFNAEDVVVVNNNAAAVLLILTAFAREKEVLISRGELIEIGGSFRLPEVFAQSGAYMVEVGTTNRTHLIDYIRAVTENTTAILVTHPSNYRVIGFTERPSLAELVAWAHENGLKVFYDLGSGYTSFLEVDTKIKEEKTIEDILRAQVDAVCFSGDKIFGGPQAGIILGKNELCETLRRHPLYRALRVDKYTLITLEAVLDYYLGLYSAKRLPVLKMVNASDSVLKKRAELLRNGLLELKLKSIQVHILRDDAVIGGGLAPLTRLPSWAVALECPDPHELARLLRQVNIPIIVRVEKNRVLFNLRTVDSVDLGILVDELKNILPRFFK